MAKSAAPPPPPAASKKGSAQSPRSTKPQARAFEIESGVLTGAERILLYGPGGVGKTTLAAYLPAPLFIDLQDGSKHLNVSRVRSVKTWAELRGTLAAIAENPPQGVKSIILDTATDAEELAKEHVIANRKTERGQSVESIEGFGWGKGWQFVFDEFVALIADLDRIAEKGLHVCLIAHEVSRPVPNPSGEDYIRWEPHLYTGDKKGRGSICERVFQWCDFAFFIGYDVFAEDGKAQGSGTRTIHTYEMPTHRAKSRLSVTPLPFDLSDAPAIWRAIGVSS
jgi:hypothetical protein